jgi:DNA-binding transcriptional MerR regulator
VPELPRKDLYKLSEVCRATDTQPYVLRFWESEFPELKPGKSAGGQRLYRKRDIDLVRRIKELLYEEEYTLDRARQQLAQELSGGRRPKPARRRSQGKEAAAPAPEERPAPPKRARRSAVKVRRKPIEERPAPPVTEVETVPRQRYEDAVEEIDHLRLELKEAEKARRRAETTAERAIDYLERLNEILS